MLIFRKPAPDDCGQIEAFKAEFGPEDMDGTGALCTATALEWLDYNRRMERRDHPEIVPCLQYALFDDDLLLGLVQLRLELRGYLLRFGGHIGYCVRPSCRRRGYAAAMLRSILDVARNEGLHRVLVTCLNSNLPSARTIEKCGGKLEAIVFDDENGRAPMRRYWIDL